MIKIEIFWRDLTVEKQNEIEKAVGNDHNYDTFPLMTLEFDKE